MRKNRPDSDADEPSGGPIALPSVRVAIPRHLRRAITASPPGTVVQLLRDDVHLADVLVERSADTLHHVRSLVQQSIAHDGRAEFVAVVGDEELAWDIDGDGERVAENPWESYARHIESRLLSSLDAHIRNQEAQVAVTEKHAEVLAVLGKTVRRVAKDARKAAYAEPADVVQRQMELQANETVQGELLAIARQVLTGGGSKPATPDDAARIASLRELLQSVDQATAAALSNTPPGVALTAAVMRGDVQSAAKHVAALLEVGMPDALAEKARAWLATVAA